MLTWVSGVGDYMHGGSKAGRGVRAVVGVVGLTGGLVGIGGMAGIGGRAWEVRELVGAKL